MGELRSVALANWRQIPRLHAGGGRGVGLEGSALGPAAALENSVTLVLKVAAGVVEDWSRSARFAAQYLAQVHRPGSPCLTASLASDGPNKCVLRTNC